MLNFYGFQANMNNDAIVYEILLMKFLNKHCAERTKNSMQIFSGRKAE